MATNISDASHGSGSRFRQRNNANKFYISQITGCFFHWLRALDTNISSKGLSRLRRQNEKLREAIKMVKALAFVPLSYLVDAFKIVLQYIAEHEEVSATRFSCFSYSYNMVNLLYFNSHLDPFYNLDRKAEKYAKKGSA